MVDATDELFDIPDRMPVILHAANQEAWLHAPPEDAMKLVAKYPADRLAIEHTEVPWFSRKPPTRPPSCNDLGRGPRKIGWEWQTIA